MSSGAFILDCSVTMAWCFEDEASAYADSVLFSLKQNKAFVPFLWKIEVSNVLLMAERKNRITEAGMIHFIRVLDELPIDIAPDSQFINMKDLVLLGRLHHLTSYDTSYLHAALSLGLPIATLDHNLIDSAQQAGASIYTP